MFLGGTDENTEGQWEWISGESWTIDFWKDGEPNNVGNEDYLVAWSGHGTNSWIDTQNSDLYSYVLEKNRVSNDTDPRNSDSDGDGLTDGYEVNTSSTDPNNADSDEDGLTDFEEINNGSNPIIYSVDEDGDGISNSDEKLIGTNPFNLDTDSDGLTDNEEILGSEYQFIEGSFSWSQARDDAIERGGNLATITSLNEWETVLNLLDSIVPSRTETSFHIWLGGTDEADEGIWEWVTGEPWLVDFTFLENPTMTLQVISLMVKITRLLIKGDYGMIQMITQF